MENGKSVNKMNDNNFKLENVEPNYQLALITYYTIINNKLNDMTGDKSTLNNVKNMVDKEMIKIVNMLNCRVLTMKGE